jgi:hypothetical protein
MWRFDITGVVVSYHRRGNAGEPQGQLISKRCASRKESSELSADNRHNPHNSYKFFALPESVGIFP